MRVRELLRENYQEELSADLNDIITFAKGSGKTRLDTVKLSRKLSDMGYSATPDAIVELLADNHMVTSVTPELIELDVSDAQSAEMDIEDSADKVAKMAQIATKKG